MGCGKEEGRGGRRARAGGAGGARGGWGRAHLQYEQRARLAVHRRRGRGCNGAVRVGAGPQPTVQAAARIGAALPPTPRRLLHLGAGRAHVRLGEQCAKQSLGSGSRTALGGRRGAAAARGPLRLGVQLRRTLGPPGGPLLHPPFPVPRHLRAPREMRKLCKKHFMAVCAIALLVTLGGDAGAQELPHTGVATMAAACFCSLPPPPHSGVGTLFVVLQSTNGEPAPPRPRTPLPAHHTPRATPCAPGRLHAWAWVVPRCDNGAGPQASSSSR